MRNRIIYFGCYEPLAEARGTLLKEAGGDVVSSTDIGETVRRVSEESIALIVVCNTCNDELYATLMDALRLSSTSIPVLRLDEGYSVAWRDPELLSSLIRASLRQEGTRETAINQNFFPTQRHA
jgi:hypothetical protein